MKWNNNTISIDKVSRPLKITGTRFASVLGLSPWLSQFGVWCELTRTYKEPFEDSIYTLAGKAIEPLQREYLSKTYRMNLVGPDDVYGQNFFNTTFGNFFKDDVFGGMWDALEQNASGKTVRVVEFKTTKRSEDWLVAPPLYYQLQVALYAYLLGVNDCTLCVTFLEDRDYKEPEKVILSAANTIMFSFKLSDVLFDGLTIQECVDKAREFYESRVLVDTPVSPEFDEKTDKDILKELRTTHVDNSADLDELLAEGDRLQAHIDSVEESIKNEEKRLAEIKDIVKEKLIANKKEEDKTIDIVSQNYKWAISISERTDVDKKKLQQDGLLDKYVSKKTITTLKVSERR